MRVYASFTKQVVGGLISGVGGCTRPSLPIFLVSRCAGASTYVAVRGAVTIPSRFMRKANVNMGGVRTVVRRVGKLYRMGVRSSSCSVALGFPIVWGVS